jgi:DNA-binding NarL/FixJ family response regulator
MGHTAEPPAEHRASRHGHLRLLGRRDDGERRVGVALDERARSRDEGAETPIRMLIAAGHELVRASYRALVERDERIEVVAAAANGRQALALAVDRAPDVALFDLALPGLDDLDAAAEIVSDAVFERIPVMLIVPREDDDRVLGVLRAGAIGVRSKDAEPAELIRAVRLLARGDAILPAGLLRRLLADLPPQSRPSGPLRDRLGELTDREREVVALVGAGLSNAEIAAQLVISPATAKTHVSRAMIKLDARHRAQLVVLAYATGLALAPAVIGASANR